MAKLAEQISELEDICDRRGAIINDVHRILNEAGEDGGLRGSVQDRANRLAERTKWWERTAKDLMAQLEAARVEIKRLEKIVAVTPTAAPEVGRVTFADQNERYTITITKE